ncbi:hypothetical protein [Cohnella soli]|uniref:Uncharacterized protein n=1 Tax=Cohnella soli TaxID=425005 RepID=A0ABW0HV50_9BACL
MGEYYCDRCGVEHTIFSPVGIQHLSHNLTREDLIRLMELSTVIPTYEVITNGIPGVIEGTHDLIREVEIAETLQQKFPNMEAYHSSAGFKDWLSERMGAGHQAAANAVSRIQGDAAGEVDFVRSVQEGIHNPFHQFDFVRNADGRITSNFPGIDAVEVSRLTGDIVNAYQVKTLRTMASIDPTIDQFINGDQYNEQITLVGPKELIDRAKELGLPNPTKVMGTIQGNNDSAQHLSEQFLSGHMETGMSVGSIADKVVGGSVIGAAISVTVSGLLYYMQYRSGRMTFQEFKVRTAQSCAKGAITGGALAGLSLFIPGGLVGWGIAFTVGTGLRRLLDEGFGNGTFGEVLRTTHAVHANAKLLHQGTLYVAELSKFNDEMLRRFALTEAEMQSDRAQADEVYEQLEQARDIGHRIDYSRSADDILDECDALQTRLGGAGLR